MLASMHAAAILLYGPMGAYALLTVVAGALAIGRRGLPGWFWTLNLLALALVGVQAAAGILRVLGGARPERPLHVLYGVLVLLVGLAQYSLHPGGLLRRVFAREVTRGEARTLALVTLTQTALIGRAWMTGLGGK